MINIISNIITNTIFIFKFSTFFLGRYFFLWIRLFRVHFYRYFLPILICFVDTFIPNITIYSLKNVIVANLGALKSNVSTYIVRWSLRY